MGRRATGRSPPRRRSQIPGLRPATRGDRAAREAHRGTRAARTEMATQLTLLEANMMNSARLGMALALTVGIAYTACALVFWIWPEASAQFMNALFHGLDFRMLQDRPSAFGLSSFGYALVGIMGWAFLVGCVFAWLANRFAVRG